MIGHGAGGVSNSEGDQAVAVSTETVDANTRIMMDALSDWLGVEIEYKRAGNHCCFTFRQPGGDAKELSLVIESGKVDPSERIRVN